jgi:hypothetical protein
VEQTEQGSFIVSGAEMGVLRQGLFVTLHHGDAVVQHSLSTITGFDLDQFRQLMWTIDELNGHNDEIRGLLGSQLWELAVLPGPELVRCSRRVREVIDAADRYGLDVPMALRKFTEPRD